MSKRVFHHPPEAVTGKKYWRSLGQLSDTPEFRGWLEKEFPQGASEFGGGEVSRRNFVQLMGASMALAGLSFAGCRRPEKHLVPFTRGAEWSIPGKALFFASAMPSRRGAMPLVVTTYDGRPTKIEGNPFHPASKGSTDLHTQSSILDLYDPDRSKAFLKDGVKSDAAAFEASLDAIIKSAATGEGLAFLLEENHSPTRERLRGLIQKKFPQATWALYEPLSHSAAKGVFAEGAIATPLIEKADVIMSLDCDFLGAESTVEKTRQFSARRKPDGEVKAMNRLYAVENRYTLTGGMADHRLRLAASQIGSFAFALAREIATLTKDPTLEALLKQLPPATANAYAEWVKVSAADLFDKKGKSLVLIGMGQPVAVHVIGAAINSALGNLDKTLVGRRADSKPASSISELSKAISESKINALVIIGGNPVYNAPADLEWSKLLGKLRDDKKTVIRVGHHEDETSELSTWHVPLAHYLESWGDALASDGSYISGQPMILPLFGGWSELDLLAKFAGQAKPKGPELVQQTFREIAKPSDFVSAWAKFLHDGFLAESAGKPVSLALAALATTSAEESFVAPVFDANTFEVVLTPDSKVDDGRYANNGWLQELPDPVTKLSWDNAALISPESARKIAVENGDIVDITVQGRSIRIPVFIAPGHADNSLSISLGYGRKFHGRVGGLNVGFNAYPLRTTTQPYILVGATVKKTGEKYLLAVTQEHGTLEGRGPDLLREGTLDDYKKKPDFAKAMGIDAHAEWKTVDGKKTEVINRSLYAHPPLSDIHQWGMTVDLSACTGCSACMVACQAENNIPIVGKEQVNLGREMHWIRIDRYFASSNEDSAEPEMVYEPMLCQHCENAPCETVCPVNATVHSEDGLNVMAYNRCIGTRYCANNCPFKVRRFNFFDYNQRDIDHLQKWNLIAPKGTEDTVKMQKNPNVTVRMRGVMEKCTFCVQRIEEAKIATNVKARDTSDVRIPADAFTVACAQACPSDAITFGDISNPASSVSKVRVIERGYRLLEYLNVSARVWYLARIRNPNMKMPGAHEIGAYSRDPHHGNHETHAAHHGGES